MVGLLGCRYFRRAFGWCVPIGGLAGLIGLGGGEFRLPVLVHGIGYGVKAAVPINLMVSFATLAIALPARGHALSVLDLAPYLPAIIGLALGGMVSAFYGAKLVQAMSSARLVQVIAALLGGIGMLLLFEAAFPFARIDIVPGHAAAQLAAGAVLGLGIGLVASMLGVAGGELLIPTLIFVFGVDIKDAGTASILISLGLIATGLWRHWRLGTLPRGHGPRRIVLGMTLGSMLGAILGGLAVAVAPVAFLKVFLGCVLLAAAGKILVTRH